MVLVGGFNLVGEDVLEVTTSSIQAEAEGAEGAAQRSSRLPLLGRWLELTAGGRCSLLLLITVHTAAHTSTLDVQEVTTAAKGANPKRAEGATSDVPAAAEGGALLRWAVNEQASAAIVTVACGVVAATQFRLVLGVAEGNVEFMEAVGELAALGVLAETRGGVGGAEFGLVAGGADPGDERRRGLCQGEQGFGQGEAATVTVYIRLLTGKQVVNQLLILRGGQEQVITTGLKHGCKGGSRFW